MKGHKLLGIFRFENVFLPRCLMNCLLSFSPSGKLVQIEYALAAVAAGAPSVGIKGIQMLARLISPQKCC